MSKLAEEVRVIDADTHLTEAHDLWTKRAPAQYRDRVQRVEDVDGEPTWVVDGEQLGFAGGGGVIDRDGAKVPFTQSMVAWGIDRIHEDAHNTDVRLKMMDACGVYAQVLFLIESVGEDNVLFETDFPHPTCIYPGPLDAIEEKTLTLRSETRRKILGENAARLYRI